MTNVVSLGFVRKGREQMQKRIAQLLEEIEGYELELASIAEKAQDSTALTDKYIKAKKNLKIMYQRAEAELFISKDRLEATITSVVRSI